jgi:hypothetical protein
MTLRQRKKIALPLAMVNAKRRAGFFVTNLLIGLRSVCVQHR